MLTPKKGYCIFKSKESNPSCEKPALAVLSLVL